MFSNLIGFSMTDDITIKPGIGLGSFIINKTLKKEIFIQEKTREYYHDLGLYFTFDKGEILTNVLITSSNYCTDKDIRVGSSINEVYAIYGVAEQQQIDIVKSSKKIGTYGTVLSYKGIQFWINNEEVTSIVVVPELILHLPDTQ
jgi:hypothetical protein